MRKLLLLSLIFVMSNIRGQNFGNEWIDYSQQYLKFPVSETGIHRLSYNELNTSLSGMGVSLSSINPDNFQVFGKQQEVAIHIEDGGDGSFDSGDYLEFYAEANDGWLDSLLYDTPSSQPDLYYSLINDTIRYYFTWNNATNNKRVQLENDVNYSAYTPQDYCWKTNYIKYSNYFVEGPKFDDISSPIYSRGEGWVGDNFNLNGTITTSVSTSNTYSGAGAPNATCRAISVSNSSSTTGSSGYNHALEITYGSSNTLVLDTNFLGYDLIDFSFAIPNSSLGTNTTAVKHHSYSVGQATDKQNVSSVTIKYPHTFDFENTNYFDFEAPYSAGKSRLSISNFNGSSPYLYIHGDTVKRVPLTDNGGIWEAVIPNYSSGEDLSCLMVESSDFISVTSISPVNGSGTFRDFESESPDSAFIIVSNKIFTNEALAYGAYRAGAGGNHDTIVAFMEELYHQYGGGIYKHPLAIKRFCSMAIQTWPSKPQYLFLLGKSLRDASEEQDLGNPSHGSRKSTYSYEQNLVPSIGYPPSDNHFTLGLEGNNRLYAIATGRFSALTNAQVQDYLDKVQEYETEQDPGSIYDIPSKEWQKEVLHFGGGATTQEALTLKTYLTQFENSIEDTLFGGNVSTYFKDPSSSVINTAEFFEIQEKLEEGVSMITFFGHASTSGGFSQNIDSPENWNNEGKYPMVLGLGCYTGDVHQPGNNSYAENMVNKTAEGAICFTSTVKLGYVSFLGNYSNIFHKQLATLRYGQSIGSSMKATVDSLESITSESILYHSNYIGMSLQGDPALKLNSHNAPEIVLDESRIWTEPTQIDLSVDTFDLNIIVTNLGSAFVDTFRVEVERHFPSGGDSIYIMDIPGVYNKDTITFKIPTQHSIAVGINDFVVRADLPFSLIAEQYDETNNNEIGFSTFISSNGLLPIWPYDFAIIANDTITCKASTIDPFAPARQYVFEIDTTDLFNSPFKREQYIMSEGGVVEARPYDWVNSNSGSVDPITFTDSTVYFWRCSPDSVVKTWEERSFQYIDGKWGWGQSHFFQFKNDSYTNIGYNRTDRTFDFDPALAQITASTFVNFETGAEWSGTNWTLAGEQQDYGGWLTPSIIVGVVDACSLEPWTATTMCVGQFNGNPFLCPGLNHMGRYRHHYIFIWHNNNPTQLDSLASFLENVVPDSNYIVAYSYVPDNYTSPTDLYDSWPPELFTAFQNLGATGMNPGQPDDGFVFFCKKGDLSSVIEEHTADTIAGGLNLPVQHLHLETFIEGCNQVGYIKTGAAGPAQNWNALYWEQHAQENPTDDTTRLRVYGITDAGVETLEIDTLMTGLDSVLNLNGLIDASVHPMLRLEAYTIDSTDITPVQIDRWQLLYDPVPELAVNPKKGLHYTITSDSIQQGDSASFAIAIENVSEFDMDSLLVHYWIEDQNHTDHYLNYPRQDSLLAGDILMDTLHFGTAQYPGINSVWVAANPKINGDEQDQVEQFYFNNLAKKTFDVIEDNINPILDVTFDGIHILDNDIVSPSPFITITLDDENEFLLLNEDADTSQFEVFLRSPGSASFDPVYFINGQGETILNWFPADNANNTFKIEYQPTFTVDGIYTLRVQGRDKANNYSGDYDYEISFEVITESSITHLYNYPNPFSTKTHFVFTLTGAEVPDQMMIQIMTIRGEVVREIMLDELGPIHIGHNKTEFFWDGRDQFGDQLANGVYLYRAIVKLNGENIKHRTTSADERSFTKEVGKMYLMR